MLDFAIIDGLVILFFAGIVGGAWYLITHFKSEGAHSLVELEARHDQALNPLLGNGYLHAKLDELIGLKITKVYYLIVNYPERAYAYEGFHLFDLGIVFEFNNQSFLSWIWLEEGASGDPEYQPVFSNVLRQVDPHVISPYTERNQLWRKVIASEITSVSLLKTQEQSEEFFTDLIIQTKSGRVQICATKEPDPQKLPKLTNIPIGSDWGVVVFNETLLQGAQRGGVKISTS